MLADWLAASGDLDTVDEAELDLGQFTGFCGHKRAGMLAYDTKSCSGSRVTLEEPGELES